MIKILIVDDHAIVRAGLKQIVSETSDMIVADEASSGHEVLNKVLKNDYDVIVLDISMPGRNGLDILAQLKTIKPNISVLILSMHPEEEYAVRAFKLGASGYLTKQSATDELVAAIRKVSKGGRYVSSSLAEQLAFELAIGAVKEPHQMLSNREYQVLCMIAQGKLITQIAEELHLSTNTISTYRSRILEKMRMKKNAELIRYAIKNRIVD